MERGVGTLENIMSQVELRQRVREQKAAQMEQVLKYRGVSYLKQTVISMAFRSGSGGEGC